MIALQAWSVQQPDPSTAIVCFGLDAVCVPVASEHTVNLLLDGALHYSSTLLEDCYSFEGLLPGEYLVELEIVSCNGVILDIFDVTITMPDVEQCTNEIDDDGDGLIDCDDPDCANDPACQIEDCVNGFDDDGDGLIDCDDDDCTNNSACLTEDCINGIDDDADGLIDCADDECFDYQMFEASSQELDFTQCQHLTGRLQQ